ncbi:hypothetical protein QZH56_37155 (plasmid) [Streptomyces olivoreticuli]|uniref:hypothetical protein n=1 Tax=Streptomyces olivoreticuli TaxID=68246 RepID=UPI0026594A15|nr:hypothetical protein [Streptomyces olivoreticuli]WKK27818.1 hypothetical protein QZH56_37155 [Streptomyces olivoreticuli]
MSEPFAIPAPPEPETPNYTKVDQELRSRGIDPSLASVPVVDPKRSPYREWLEEYAGSLGSVVVARPQRQWYTFNDLHQVSPNRAYNPGPGETAYGMSWTDTTSVTTSIEFSASVSVGFKLVAEVSMSTTYGTSWTKETSTGENITVSPLPGWMGWIDRATMLSHLKGEFIWTGIIRGNFNGAPVNMPLPGEKRKPFRWNGECSGPGIKGSMTGILVTSQLQASAAGAQRIERIVAARSHDNAFLLPAEIPLDVFTSEDKPA